jgi:dCMP deaminase
MTRPSWDDYFMRYAYLAATRATCPRKHVGAVIVDPEHRVVATGYNGSPPNVPSCDDIGCQMVENHCVRTLHAESNALDYAGTRLAHNGTLYVTVTPCWDCAKRIIGARIMRVVYDEHYESRYGKSTDVPDYLREHGVEVERFDEKRMVKFKALLNALDAPNVSVTYTHHSVPA